MQPTFLDDTNYNSESSQRLLLARQVTIELLGKLREGGNCSPKENSNNRSTGRNEELGQRWKEHSFLRKGVEFGAKTENLNGISEFFYDIIYPASFT